MDSILLQKQVRDNAKALEEYCKELKEWGDEMKKHEESLKRSPSNHTEMPLPRNKLSKMSESITDKNEIVTHVKKTKRIKACDYAAWEKFDADAYCAKLNKEENSSPESELSDEIDENTIDLANSEKEKGNAFVKKQQWEQAIECYTRAIENYAYDPIYYANRALCYLKKEKYQNAESDSTTALQLDKTYVKAYQRRAAARENLNQIPEAHSDILKVLELEPKNKESKIILTRLEKKLENIKQIKSEAEQQRPVSKFTLSHSKHKKSKLEVQSKPKKEVPAFGEHVIERVLPSNFNSANKVQLTESDNKGTTSAFESSEIDIKSKSIANSTFTSKLSDDLLLNKHNISIQLFQNIHKPVKTRSKQPLKRIEIIDVDLKTGTHFQYNTPKNITKEQQTKHKNIESIKKGEVEEGTLRVNAFEKSEANTIEKDKEKLSVKDAGYSFQQLHFLVPKSAVQFYKDWKSISGNKEYQKIYLQNINPNNLAIIFKESLESKVFSEIIQTINYSISNGDASLYNYLIGLAQVKRFGALVMFMSTQDKKCLLNIVDYLKQDNKCTNSDVDKIIKLYEL